MLALTIDPVRMCFMEEGEPWPYRGCSPWGGLGYLINNGELAYRDLLVDRRSVGVNVVQHFLMWSRWPNLHPSNPKWWDSLTPMAHIAHEEGMRITPFVFASTGDSINGAPVEWLGMPPGVFWPGMPTLAEQHPHWTRVLTHLGAEPNVNLFVVANQPGHRDQRTPSPEETGQFNKVFPHQLICRNNPNEEQNPALPVKDWSGACTSRRMPQGCGELAGSMWSYIQGWRERPHVWSGTKGLTVATELPRIEEDDPLWMDPWKWRQIARAVSCYWGSGGGSILSDQDRYCQILTGETRRSYIEFCGNVRTP